MRSAIRRPPIVEPRQQIARDVSLSVIATNNVLRLGDSPEVQFFLLLNVGYCNCWNAKEVEAFLDEIRRMMEFLPEILL